MNSSELVYPVVFSTLIILLLIAGVIITLFIANRQKTRQTIELAQAKLDYEREMRTVAAEVQEQVLSGVSHELHDNIGQLLLFAKLQVEQEKMKDEASATRLSSVSETIASVINQVRLLSHSLDTGLVTARGLPSAIEQEVIRLQELNHLTIHWQHDGGNPPLDKDQSLMAFRIFQELIANTLKHAAAAHVYIHLDCTGQFSLRVRDDGKGFDPEAALQSSSGAGLKNMMKRASLARLICRLEAAPGKGTVTTISVHEP